MPNFGFYASRADAAPILEFILSGLECRILDAYSEPDRPLGRYETVNQVLAAYVEETRPAVHARAVHAVLWRPDFGPEPIVRRIDFTPAKVPARTGRFMAKGWGLLVLQLQTEDAGRPRPSKFAVNSESRAHRWADTYAERFGPVEAWNWAVMSKTAQRLQYHIAQRLAIGKRGSRPILSGAEAAARARVVLEDV